MDMTNFGFITEAVQAVSQNDIPIDVTINYIGKIYNLLLLWFWFDIVRYIMHVFEVVRARFNKFNGKG